MKATLRALLLAAVGAVALAACGEEPEPRGADEPVDMEPASEAVSGSSAKGEPGKRAARCDVVVDDIGSGSKALIQETFYWLSNTEVSEHRRYFALPGVTDGMCNLAFFPENGTSVACEMDTGGWRYVQSDRSAFKEFPNRNQLTFRLSGVHLTIEVTCS